MRTSGHGSARSHVMTAICAGLAACRMPAPASSKWRDIHPAERRDIGLTDGQLLEHRKGGTARLPTAVHRSPHNGG